MALCWAIVTVFSIFTKDSETTTDGQIWPEGSQKAIFSYCYPIFKFTKSLFSEPNFSLLAPEDEYHWHYSWKLPKTVSITQADSETVKYHCSNNINETKEERVFYQRLLFIEHIIYRRNINSKTRTSCRLNTVLFVHDIASLETGERSINRRNKIRITCKPAALSIIFD